MTTIYMIVWVMMMLAILCLPIGIALLARLIFRKVHPLVLALCITAILSAAIIPLSLSLSHDISYGDLENVHIVVFRLMSMTLIFLIVLQFTHIGISRIDRKLSQRMEATRDTRAGDFD